MSFGASGTTSINGGNITTGVINLGNDSGMAIRQGKNSYSSNTTGFWLGNDSGTPKFHIGTSSNFLKFTGSNLEVAGTLKMVSGGSTTTLSNANTLNASVALSKDGSGNLSLTNGASGNVNFDNSDVGLGNVNNSNFDSSGDIVGGHIGGININASKIWSGTGSYNNTNTPVYLDNNGYFSLENKLKWDPGNNRLDVKGHLEVESISFASGVNVDYTNVGGTKPPSNATANQADSTVNAAIAAKSKVFRQNNTPTALAAGDVWIDTNDGNKLYVASAAGTGSWNLAQDSDSKTTASEVNSAAKTGGSIGGWQLNANNIFSGSSPDANGYTSSGMTLNSGGSIHAKQFYIDTSGNAKFKGEIESGGTVRAQALDLDGTTLTGGSSGLKISTSGVDTNELQNNSVTQVVVDELAQTLTFAGGSGASFNDVVDISFTASIATDAEVFVTYICGGGGPSNHQFKILHNNTSIFSRSNLSGGSKTFSDVITTVVGTNTVKVQVKGGSSSGFTATVIPFGYMRLLEAKR